MSVNPLLSEPAIARWELWSVANMMLSTHGEHAEAAANEQLKTAIAENDEGGVIVWRGVVTQLERIKSERAS